MSTLNGKVAVVTGATSGIGEAITAQLVERGAAVVGVGRDEAKLGLLSAKHGNSFTGVAADLADEAARSRLIEQVSARFERVDFLINNAAEVPYAAPLETAIDRWRALREVNLLAAIDLTQRLVPRMGGTGHVVNVSSVSGRFAANARFGTYAVTKRALDGFTDAVRLELEGTGVKVTSIVPGLVDTPVYGKVAGFEKTLKRLRDAIPTWLSAGDIAAAVVWALEQPVHVVIAEMVVLPKGQSR
ncbi:MAG: SDR family NAD(P)-dependent oxidoreductase [Polyangiaceae bacterium]|nr:SDR family NAD(P)-dependent oxidoreductase [Polyangiaceae bacterium]